MGLEEFFGGGSGPATTDPAAYTRAVQVTDGKCLMAMTECDRLGEALGELQRKLAKLNREAAILSTQREAVLARLFGELEQLHPEILDPTRPGGTRWVTHEGKRYYVAWGGSPGGGEGTR